MVPAPKIRRQGLGTIKSFVRVKLKVLSRQVFG